MRFPQAEQLYLPCTFAQFIPGQMSADGRRVLPIIMLQPSTLLDGSRAAPIGVVDRHHVVDPALVGATGVARLVWLLSSFRVQSPPFVQRLVPEEGLAAGRASMMPTAEGRVVAVLSWEEEKEHLPYEVLYTELLVDVGIGIVGVRTSVTAPSLAEAIGKPQLAPGDHIFVSRSRIDILGFEPINDEGRITNE